MKVFYCLFTLLFVLLSIGSPAMAQSNISIEVDSVQNELHDYGYEVGYLQFTYTPPDSDVWLSIGATDNDTYDFGVIVENVYLPSSQIVGTDTMTITIPFDLTNLAPFTVWTDSGKISKATATTRSNLHLYIHALKEIGFYPFDPSTFIYETDVTVGVMTINASNGPFIGTPPTEDTGETKPHVAGEKLVNKVIRTKEVPIIDLDASKYGPNPETYPGGDENACVPASVSNSIMWMAKKYKGKLDLMGLTHRQILTQLSNDMNRKANKGVATDSAIIVGKLDFFEDLGAKNIEVKFQSISRTGKTPAERNIFSSSKSSVARNLNSRADGKPQWDFLEKMMNDGEDVELEVVFYGRDPQTKKRVQYAHSVTCSGIERYENGKKVVWVSDDENHRETNSKKLTIKPMDVTEWKNGHIVLGRRYIVTAIIAESPVILDGKKNAAFTNEVLVKGQKNLQKSSAVSGPFLEIALQSTITDLENYLITIYDGADGTIHKTLTLDQFSPGSTENGYNIYTYQLTDGDLPAPNGGISISYSGSVIENQFISYGGQFYATEGDAAYMYSHDIGNIVDNEAFSLSGFGYQYGGLKWGTTTNISPGTINEGEGFTTSIPGVPTLAGPEDNTTSFVDTVTFSWSSDSANSYRLTVSTDSQFGTTFLDSTNITDTSFTVAGFSSNTSYYWKVDAYNSNGESGYSATRSFNINITGVNEKEAVPTKYFIHQNYPNPFNPSTTTEYGLPSMSRVEISIYDIQGRKLSSKTLGNLDAGYHSYVWNAETFPSGVYFLKINATSLNDKRQFQKSIKMMLIK